MSKFNDIKVNHLLFKNWMKGYFCHFVILSAVILSAKNLQIILSAGHFVRWLFCQLVILSVGHFVSWSFCQLVILLVGYFVSWLFC
jgi:hypothetical protein